MATSAASPKHSKSLLRRNSTKSPKNLSRILKRKPDKSTALDNSSDSDIILLDSLGGLSLSPMNPTEAAKSGYRAVVAIDFGTTYSGYAYSFTHRPDDIHLMRSSHGVGRYGAAMTHKVPTILLLNGKGGFHSFGHEAREAYHDLDEHQAQSWLYFEKFKLELHTRKDLNTSMELQASNGQRALATIVFGHALQYFKDCCIKELNDVSIVHSVFTVEDVQWVVTVPAIWRQSAKQFMRYAAVQAGLIKSDNWKQLLIALEPEAASIFCQSLYTREKTSDVMVTSPVQAPSPSTGAPKYKTDFLEHSSSPEVDLNASTTEEQRGLRYIVADCGGGTVDLTVHELSADKKLKELHKATGGTWGSMGVDCQFEILLTEIFGEDFLVDFVQNKPISWLELINTFEAKKCLFSPSKQVAVSIALPFSFIESYMERTGKTVRSAIQEYNDDAVQWSSQGMLRLQPSVMTELFEPAVSAIVAHIQELLLLPAVKRVEYLFLVGGFAESPLLQEAVQKAFQQFLKVVIPQNVSLTILKGAVMFGHDPTVVHIRRSLYTYGVATLNPFIDGKHPEEKRVMRNKQEWCSEVFDAFVYADQAISFGHKVTRSYTVADSGRQSTVITLYATESETVEYIDDPGTSRVGQVAFGLAHRKTSESREIVLSMYFGDTEIRVEAVDSTSGQTARASFDFLTK